MRPPSAFLSAIAVSLVAAACSGATPTPVPGSTSAPPTPVIATPTPGPTGATYWLRMTSWQAIPPQNLFAFTPAAVITGDGRFLVPGAVPAIFPGPLVTPLAAREVSAAGQEAIIGWARELGLLSGKTDFVGDLGLAGGMTGRIELTVDGQQVTLTGVPEVDGVLEPGTPVAFSELWRRITSLPATLPAELGPEQPYTPTAYAILIGPPPIRRPVSRGRSPTGRSRPHSPRSEGPSWTGATAADWSTVRMQRSSDRRSRPRTS